MARQITPLPRALVRSELLMGAEREPMIALMGGAVLMLVSALTHMAWAAAVISGTILMVGMRSLRALAKSDPKWFAVFLRRVKIYGLSVFYPARTSPYRKNGPPCLSRVGKSVWRSFVKS